MWYERAEDPANKVFEPASHSCGLDGNLDKLRPPTMHETLVLMPRAWCTLLPTLLHVQCAWRGAHTMCK